MAKKYDKDALIADYKTGAYTQRDLAYNYGISKTMVAKLTKGIPKDGAEVVAKLVEAKHKLNSKSAQEVTAIDKVVSKELEKRAKAEKIDNFLDGALGIAAQKAVEIIQDEDAGMQDVVGFGKFQLDARKGLGTLIENNTSQVNVQQNNEQMKVTIIDA